LEFFHETKTFFQLKEIEKRVSKEKGITVMAIAGVVQELVDDGMVHLEKIGTSNYYWSYPSEQTVNLKRKLTAAEDLATSEKGKRKRLDGELTKAQEGREDSDERKALLTELASEHQRQTSLAGELASLADSDPEVIQAKMDKTALALAAANRCAIHAYHFSMPPCLHAPATWHCAHGVGHHPRSCKLTGVPCLVLATGCLLCFFSPPLSLLPPITSPLPAAVGPTTSSAQSPGARTSWVAGTTRSSSISRWESRKSLITSPD
jgi:hypothetical protein